jgi:hypothetical protein
MLSNIRFHYSQLGAFSISNNGGRRRQGGASRAVGAPAVGELLEGRVRKGLRALSRVQRSYPFERRKYWPFYVFSNADVVEPYTRPAICRGRLRAHSGANGRSSFLPLVLARRSIQSDRADARQYQFFARWGARSNSLPDALTILFLSDLFWPGDWSALRKARGLPFRLPPSALARTLRIMREAETSSRQTQTGHEARPGYWKSAQAWANLRPSAY